MQSNHDQLQAIPAKSRRRLKLKVEEVLEDRAERLYQARGGPLIGWLEDEAQRKGHSKKELCERLGISYGYLVQLRLGIRGQAATSERFVSACAAYLEVPPIVVKFLAGWLRIADFFVGGTTEDVQVRRAMARLLEDEHARVLLPDNVQNLPFEAQQALLSMYAECSSVDVFSISRLPGILEYLKPAAAVFAEHQARAALALASEDSIDEPQVEEPQVFQ
ncbi:hypothetical protein [Castellaniella sp.]|uniref:hypothetical protein n=1 Tax=Castellaniella sp. TaxID=1955812 RepID=UPI002AFF9305|nr:hypothetical protein [Castellaniella sp.]